MNSSIAAQFDRRAARYDNRISAYIAEWELRQIRHLIPANSTVLDYGCGTGRTTLDLLRRGCEVTAFDISRGMLAQAKAKVRSLGLAAEFVTDQTQLLGRSWPIIACIGVLDYYRDPLPLLLDLGHYLEPGGDLVVTYPNALSPMAWLYALGSRWSVPAIPRTPGSARRAARRAGLQVDVLCFAFPSLAFLGHTMILRMSHPSFAYQNWGRT